MKFPLQNKKGKMEKKEITIKSMKPVFFDYGNMTEIEVKPYISIDEKRRIAEAYLASFFDSDSENSISLNEFQAEYALILATVDLCTNLSIDFSGDFEKFDNLISSGLWNQIKESILNYNEFRLQIDSIVKHVREDIAVEKSTGAILEKIVDSLNDILKKVSSSDFSQEAILDALKQVENKTTEFQEKVLDSPVKLAKPARKKRASKKEVSQ